VPRRQAQLVDPVDVLRVGDRDEQAVLVLPVRDRDRLLQRVQRDQRRGLVVDLGLGHVVLR
jgi:hypothetical protein